MDLDRIIAKKAGEYVTEKNSKIQKALQQKRQRKDKPAESATDRLIVDEFFNITPLKLNPDTWKDHKKLTKFLENVRDSINALNKACQVQTRLVATEMIARPTYAEEFTSIRENIHKVVIPNNDGTFSDLGSQRSGRSFRSITKSRKPKKKMQVEIPTKDVIVEEAEGRDHDDDQN